MLSVAISFVMLNVVVLGVIVLSDLSPTELLG
jgi:hypothetical protein